jgi:deoxyribodipyrimidine photo-lyase
MSSGVLFPTDYDSILKRIDAIDPVKYARTRNFKDGAVTYLSPYISRGVISLPQVVQKIKEKGYGFMQAEKLIQELAWREYFQRVLQVRPDADSRSLRQEQAGALRQGIPVAVLEANTGIDALDLAIKELYQTGYMHNHLRMYVASVVCNIAKCHWSVPAKWMYAHLLDADPASNFCSWQWVCGAFSSKTYVANQENINRYCQSVQTGSFLDVGYDELVNMKIPGLLEQVTFPESVVPKDEQADWELISDRPVLLYDIFNLDPLWYAGEDINRVLILDSELLMRLPLSGSVLDFIVKLSRNIPGILIWQGTFPALERRFPEARFIFREHPLITYKGVQEERMWLFPEVSGYHSSFSAYWKKCQKHLKRLMV